MRFDRDDFWPVPLALLGLSALLSARGVAGVLDARHPHVEPPPAGRGARLAGWPAFHGTSADAILARNPFDSITGALIPEPRGAIGAPAHGDPASAPPCDDVRVLAIAASAEPDWSFGAFSARGDPKTVLRRRGGGVGDRTVAFIGWDRVWMTRGAELCQASMFTGDPIVTGALDAGVTGGGGEGGVDPTLLRGIRKRSATERDVDRSVVERLLENPSALLGVRVLPDRRDGQILGLRLLGIRPDSLLGVLGLEEGDRLQTINGLDVSTAEKALEAYARVRTADRVTAVVNRRGKVVTLDFAIQ